MQVLFNLSPLNKMVVIFADDIFRSILVNEKFCILIKISLKFVFKGPIGNNTTLVYIDNGLMPNRRQAIILTNADPLHWRIYAAPGGEMI